VGAICYMVQVEDLGYFRLDGRCRLGWTNPQRLELPSKVNLRAGYLVVKS